MFPILSTIAWSDFKRFPPAKANAFSFRSLLLMKDKSRYFMLNRETFHAHVVYLSPIREKSTTSIAKAISPWILRPAHIFEACLDGHDHCSSHILSYHFLSPFILFLKFFSRSLFLYFPVSFSFSFLFSPLSLLSLSHFLFLFLFPLFSPPLPFFPSPPLRLSSLLNFPAWLDYSGHRSRWPDKCLIRNVIDTGAECRQPVTLSIFNYQLYRTAINISLFGR